MPVLDLHGAFKVEVVLELQYVVLGNDVATTDRKGVVLHVMGAQDVEGAIALVRAELKTVELGYDCLAKVLDIRFDSVGPVREVPANGMVVLA